MGERQIVLEGLVPNLAARMGVDPTSDPRPRLLAHTLHAVTTTAWSTWLEHPTTDIAALVDDMLAAFEPVFDRLEATDRA